MNLEQPKKHLNLAEWKNEATKKNYKVRLVTNIRNNSYYQASQEGVVKGFFNTGIRGGELQ